MTIRLNAAHLREVFDRAPPYTIGVEEELMLLDPGTYELAPRAVEVMSLLSDPRFKLEMPASQLEIATSPAPTVSAAVAALRDARETIDRTTREVIAPACAGVHPFSDGRGKLNTLPRYQEILSRYGPIANRQLVCAFQVHVSVGSASRALAIYNAVRSYLPLLAALAANAPFYEGQDTGLASVRPKLAELLPRQGIPPTIESWEDYEGNFRWGEAAGGVVSPGTWWWELRPHPAFGTLEFRTPDSQTSLDHAAAIAAVIHALVRWLGEQHDGDGALEVASDWRIAENRWSACSRGVQGTMADLRTGRVRSTRDWLSELLDELVAPARILGCSSELEHARTLIETNGAMELREAAAQVGIHGLGAWLNERFVNR